VRSLTNSRATHAPPTQHAVRWCLRAAVLALVATQLTACSKTVVWEEEVPLNTGEVIWVKRTVEYSYQGGGGNPLDMAYRPDWPELTEFTWDGKKYAYKGDAVIFVLAISPRRLPVLVARAGDGAWDAKNDYRCAVPHYVQFIPDKTGKTWTWPPAIEPWLYHLPANLLRGREAAEKMSPTYTAAHRHKLDGPTGLQFPSTGKIDPSYSKTEPRDRTCRPKETSQ
jgi:hypothetical protein